MTFNLASYLIQQGVSYIERGPNVQKNNINICCPMCGDDPSYHLGINIDTGFWGCWRYSKHRGKRPDRLLRMLFGYSWDRIQTLVGDENVSSGRSLDEMKELLEGKKLEEDFELAPQNLLREFKPITDSGYGSRYIEYLVDDRKFDSSDVPALISRFDLRYCVSGEWRDRIIIPIRVGGNVVGWTGRSLGRAEIRYRNFPSGSQTKKLIFNYDKAEEGGRVLVPVEGPFDAMKVDFYGDAIGIVSVGFLGVAVTSHQINALAKLSRRFDEFALLLDNDDAGQRQGLELSSRLSCLRAKSWRLPLDVKDPGELSSTQVKNFSKNF